MLVQSVGTNALLLKKMFFYKPLKNNLLNPNFSNSQCFPNTYNRLKLWKDCFYSETSRSKKANKNWTMNFFCAGCFRHISVGPKKQHWALIHSKLQIAQRVCYQPIRARYRASQPQGGTAKGGKGEVKCEVWCYSVHGVDKFYTTPDETLHAVLLFWALTRPDCRCQRSA